MCPRLFTLGPLSLPWLEKSSVFAADLRRTCCVRLPRRPLPARKAAKRHGFDADKMTNLGVYVALAAIVGAKLFKMLLDIDVY